MNRMFDEWNKRENLGTGPFNSARDAAGEGHDAGIGAAKGYLV
ncbi:hypothetical protein ACWGI8_06095 [Streptomyces sp. NPDC054841]